jgi:hypothetical protein
MHPILDDGQITFLRQRESLSLAKWLGDIDLLVKRWARLGSGLRPSPFATAGLGCSAEIKETFGQVSAGSALCKVLREDPRRAESR